MCRGRDADRIIALDDNSVYRVLTLASRTADLHRLEDDRHVGAAGPWPGPGQIGVAWHVPVDGLSEDLLDTVGVGLPRSWRRASALRRASFGSVLSAVMSGIWHFFRDLTLGR
jgi:hypothetical protein